MCTIAAVVGSVAGALGASAATAATIGAVVSTVVTTVIPAIAGIASAGMSIAKAIDGDVEGAIGYGVGAVAAGSMALDGAKDDQSGMFDWLKKDDTSADYGTYSSAAKTSNTNSRLLSNQKNASLPGVNSSLLPKFESFEAPSSSFSTPEIAAPQTASALQNNQAFEPAMPSFSTTATEALTPQTNNTYTDTKGLLSQNVSSESLQNNANAGTTSSGLLGGLGNFVKDNKDLVTTVGSGLSQWSKDGAEKDLMQMRIDASKDAVKANSMKVNKGQVAYNPASGKFQAV